MSMAGFETEKLDVPLAWSYSRWNDYDGCPAKFRAKYLGTDEEKAQFKESDEAEPGAPETPMQRGSRIHKLGEDFLKGKIAVVPKEFSKFKKEMLELKKLHASSEESWAYDAAWEPCEYFSKRPPVAVRMKVDTHVVINGGEVLRAIDFKTGKVKDYGLEPQLELVAIGGFLRYKKVKRVETEFWFLDHGESRQMNYGEWQLDVMKENWERRTRKMLVDTLFEETPSNMCKWCPRQKDKPGGTCKF